MLFRFAVIADTHVNPSETDNISPFESHRLTNARLHHTVNVLNALKPSFVVHVGDMVHPVPEAKSYPQAVAQFRAAVEPLQAPLHLVPGNHDCGDKPADYVPAGSICAEYVALYRNHFGQHYYGFSSHGCRFIVINTSLHNSGLPEEAAQVEWLEAELELHARERRFLFVHYPPFVAHAQEPGHYDNIDEPGRGWLLGLLARHAIEAVFTGHVHNFFLNRHASTPLFLMPSTAFVRADYAEMFQVTQPPGHENGRNDAAKLGVLVIDVYGDRIVPQFIRTLNDADGAGTVQHDWPRLPPAAGPLAAPGIDLRHDWTAIHSIPYSSMLDEFRRKQARNDYSLLALWEMGVRELRVPLDDLLCDGSRERMALAASFGSRFTVFRFGLPCAEEMASLHQHRSMLAGLEVVLRWPPIADLGVNIAALKELTGLPIILSRFWNASGESRDGRQIKLLVDHGFTVDDPELPRLLERLSPHSADGVVFRIGCNLAAHEGIERAVAWAQASGLAAQVHVRLADDSPAVARTDEWHNMRRVLVTALCSHGHRGHRVFLDTLTDVDRGYFPRVGLIDRLYNPRLAGRALRNLNGALSELPVITELGWTQAETVLVGQAVANGLTVFLILPENCVVSWRIDVPSQLSDARWSALDLITGDQQPLTPQSDANGGSHLAGRAGAPALLIAGC